MTAIDIGARLIACDKAGRVVRIEEAGRRFADESAISLTLGRVLDEGERKQIAERMADRLFETMSKQTLTTETAAFLRLDPLANELEPDILTFSGGVSEYAYGHEGRDFGDLGAYLASAIMERAKHWGPRLERAAQGIRATVVGASQYTIQVSGSTIFVEPHETLPLRNLPAITPSIPWAEDA